MYDMVEFRWTKSAWVTSAGACECKPVELLVIMDGQTPAPVGGSQYSSGPRLGASKMQEGLTSHPGSAETLPGLNTTRTIRMLVVCVCMFVLSCLCLNAYACTYIHQLYAAYTNL